MEKNNLKSYLMRIMELEKNKFELEQILLKLKNTKYSPDTMAYESRKVESSGNFGCLPWIGGIAGFFLAGMFVLPGNTIMIVIMIVLGIAAGIAIECSIQDKDIEKQRVELKQKNSEIDRYNMAITTETENKNKLINSSANRIQSAINETDAEIMQLYSENIIYPKYRNLVAISSIYEYLDSGRCEQLEGADGAYNIYEMEIRLDRIITKLDVIIVNLEQIRNNQFYLYSAINELKTKIDVVTNAIIENTNKLNEIEVNTAITAYTAQVIERNQYYGRNWKNGQTYYDRINMNRLK